MAMTRFLLDTGMASDFINRRRGVFERTREETVQGNRVGICVPVLAELVYGVEYSASRDRNMEVLQRAISALKLWPFDGKAAFEYGRIAAELRTIGRPMQVVDMMVAAVAFALGNCIVVSGDSDLTAVPALKVQNWAT
jgi:tRNA(fMet)-specific endonuclease VapC